jgi:hypothetical protein
MKDNQHEQLFTELTAEFEARAFTELDDEVAAAIQGGSDLEVYRHANQKDWLGGFNFGKDKLSSNADNQISSIKVNAGRWAFFDKSNYLGASWTVSKPGNYNVPEWFNDRTTSLRRY